jgi:hypothetical protein
LLSNGSTAGIRLFVPDYMETDSAMKVIGYLLLDQALRNDVETQVGLIEMYPIDKVLAEERHPRTELPKQSDRLVVSPWPSPSN